MIQRIQTVFLLLITLISITLFFVPFVAYTTAQKTYSVDLLPGHSAGFSPVYYVPVVFNIINMILSVVVILQFKKRIFQIKMASLLMAFSAILLGTMLLFDFVDFGPNAVLSKAYLPGAYLPIVSILLAFLSIRFIRKDEELVRSADRLR